MNKLLNKNKIIIFISCLSIILSIVAILLYIVFRKKLVFKLIGNDIVIINIYEKYNEQGAVAIFNKKDLSNKIVIDSSNLNTNELGIYEVTYKLKYEDNEMTLVRKVKVVDSIAPVITLNGEKEVNIVLGNEYKDDGCLAVDNFDEDVKGKIQIINQVNNNVVGEYKVICNVVDESGNKSSETRKVNVIPNVLNDDSDNVFDFMDSNRITHMSLIEDGIYIEGYVKDNNGNFKIRLYNNKKSDYVSYDMKKKDKYYYSGNIKLSNLKNGTYYMWVNSKKDEKAVNKIDLQYRIARSKIKDKLVTFYYDNNNIKIVVDDFKYEYDILIDPGHGGIDPGASNSIVNENTLNLVQSLYEKKRYEEHGLKVLLLRDDSSYGIVMGDNSWPLVRRKAYALGYYGVTSKITYSNHHNSSEDLSMSGWEIIVTSNSNKEDLNNVNKIKDRWNKNYRTLEKHVRVYTRNYNTGKVFSKENNEQYYFSDYYAVLRLPYQLFGIKNVLFEGSYLSNSNDFDYYYTNDNWKKFSEDKIKVFVESLGIKYIEPTL